MGIFANALKRFGRPGYQTESSQRHLAEQGLLAGPRPEAPSDADAEGE
jgi:hypothetical protein